MFEHTVTPKWLSDTLTGNGGKRGFLSVDRNDPANFIYSYPSTVAGNLMLHLEPKAIPKKLWSKETIRGFGDPTVIVNLTPFVLLENNQKLWSNYINVVKNDHLMVGKTTVVPILITRQGSNGAIIFAEKTGRTVTFTRQLNKNATEYNLYEAVNYMVNRLANVAGDDLTKALKNVKNREDYLKGLSRLKFNLNHYRTSYEAIGDVEDVNSIIETDTNMLMLHTLRQLKDTKHLHAELQIPTPEPHVEDWLTPDQRAAVTTTKPFVLVQAGAGTGKSTTVAERIKFLTDCGVAPSDIRVLSLTNVAADNITAKSPDVKSSTIASFINDNYKRNFPNHRIVDEVILASSIRLYAKHEPFAHELEQFVSQMGRNQDTGFVAVLREHFDDVIRVLDKVGQTTLSLQAYIAYVMGDDFQIEEKLNHVIIDETQDNNVFEFIYTMDLIRRNNGSIYIVGDASQTLFEFRGASAMALNAIETSGLFDIITLRTNYRSTQEILDYANIILSDIEVNRYAKIQLDTGKDPVYDLESLENTITVNDVFVKSAKDFDPSNIEHHVPGVKHFIEEGLKSGEQIAVLAYDGKTVRGVGDYLHRTFPNAKVGSIMPSRDAASSIFSRFWSSSTNDLRGLPNPSVQMVNNHVRRWASHSKISEIAVDINLNKWMRDQSTKINQLNQQVASGRMLPGDFFDAIQNNMIQFEINNNIIQKALQLEKDEMTDKLKIIENVDVVLSTVHSSKGLEFDRVVFVTPDAKDASEDRKRLIYVALTRAKKKEFIVATASRKQSSFTKDFNDLIDHYTSHES